MTHKIPESKIEQIRERVDIVELVGSYLSLKRSGANHFGLCPFHGEKTPSFSVHGGRQIFHCFGCGEGGDAIAFLMRMEGLSFPDAVRRLGERAGIEVEDAPPDPEEEQRRRERERLYRINEVAADYYHRVLVEAPEGGSGRRYLRGRGFDGEIARRYRLGFAPPGWESLVRHLAAQGVDAESCRQLGLVRPGKQGRGDYDLFRNRLIFPIVGTTGQVVAFGARALGDEQPKYINSPESPIYHKGRVLYGLWHGREAMRRSGEVIVVEGYFDQLALARAGFENSVATCGTALTEEHARLLKRYAQRVLLLFDQDAAGLRAAFKAIEPLLAEGLPAAMTALPAGDDPDSFLAEKGQEAFRRLLDGARPALEVHLEALLAEAGGSVEGKAKAAEAFCAKLGLLKSELERDLYLKMLAEKTGLSPDALAAWRRKHSPAPAPRRETPPPPPQAPVPSAPAPRSAPRSGGPRRYAQTQRLLLHNLVAAPQRSCPAVIEQGGEGLFLDPEIRRLAGAILALYRESGEVEQKVLRESLSPEQESLMDDILKNDETATDEELATNIHDCLQHASRDKLKERMGELRRLIQEAMEQGDAKGLAAYQEELKELKKG